MKRIQEGLEETLEAGARCGHSKTEGTCRKIFKHKEALWTFVTEEGVEPTNNRAEQIIRVYMMWRKTSFGTQSDRGDRYVERIMTASTCCRLQNRNLPEYLTEAISAHISRKAYPSLLPPEKMVLEENMAAYDGASELLRLLNLNLIFGKCIVLSVAYGGRALVYRNSTLF